jgi:hypothetical protein
VNLDIILDPNRVRPIININKNKKLKNLSFNGNLSHLLKKELKIFFI